MKKGPRKHSRDDADSDISSQDSEKDNKKLKSLEKKRPPVIAIDDLAANKQVKKKAPVITHQQFLEACRTGDLVKLELGLRSLNRFLIAVASDNEALRLAAASGHIAVVNRLLEIDSVRENAAARDNEALRFAALNGHLAVVNRLLEIDSVRANAAAIGNAALQLTAQRGHLAVVNRLLEIDSVRANAACNDNLALRYAAENGHLSVVNRLLEIEEVKTNVDADSNDALKSSVSNNHYRVAIRLFKESAIRQHMQYLIDNQMQFFTSAFEDARQQYAKAKTTAVHALNQTPLSASLRKMILQAAFHDTECGKSSCLTAAPSTITNAVTFCLMFNPKAAINQPLVELVQPQLLKKKRNRP